LACVFTAFSMPIILYFARKQGLFDSVNDRKIHNGKIPRLGGIGIAAGFTAAMVALMVVQGAFIEDFRALFRIWPMLFGGMIMLFLGLIDDLVELRARIKLAVQVLLALLLLAFDFRFRVIMVPWGDGALSLGYFSYPITLAWVIGITNAINLIDGLDGLAGVVGFIASLTFGIFFWAKGSPLPALLCFTLTGAITGFLIFNLPPAKIFMGDSGSLFLGFCLAALPLLGQNGNSAEIGLISAITTLAIPIFDTLAAIYRRKKAGVSFLAADRGHIHHVLLEMAGKTWKVLVVIGTLNLVLAAAALSTLFLPASLSFFLKLAALLASAIFFMIANRAKTRNAR
jgi:UDP-GlcNAc:undecaprenyl-phosphate GlcNAc-1-phosphate transferase